MDLDEIPSVRLFGFNTLMTRRAAAYTLSQKLIKIDPENLR